MWIVEQRLSINILILWLLVLPGITKLDIFNDTKGHVKLFCLLCKTTDMGKAWRGLWSGKTMKLAVKAALADGLSNVKTSQCYGVPLETLRRKVGQELVVGREEVGTSNGSDTWSTKWTVWHTERDGVTNVWSDADIDVCRIVFQYINSKMRSAISL